MVETGNKLDLCLLPYIKLSKPVQIGDVVFWPYHEKKEEFIGKIPNAISHFDKIARLFRRFYDDKPIETVVAASFLDQRAVFKPKDLEKIHDAVDLLAYVGIIQKNVVRFFAYDNFSMNVYTSNLDKESGVLNMTSKFGQWSMVEVSIAKIQTPHYIHIDSIDSIIESGVFLSLKDLFEKAYDNTSEDGEKKEALRIIRAISWFNQSSYADPLITNYSAIVFLAVALETLLRIKEISRKSAELSNAIQLLLGESEEISAWGNSFYDVRSKILHGEKVESLRYGARQHSSHIVLAQIVFEYCLKAKLRLLRRTLSDNPFDLILSKPLSYYLVSNFDRITEILGMTMDELRDPKKLIQFKRLLFSLNTETDFSGSQIFYKQSIQKVAYLAKEGLKRVTEQQKGFEEETNETNSILEKVISGDLSEVKKLTYVETFWPDNEEVKINSVKFIEVVDGLQVADFFYLINQMLELWENCRWRERPSS